MGNYFAKRKLRNLNTDKVSKFSFEGTTRWVRVCNVYDGDTVTIVLLFNGHPYKFQLRMSGYDCPEMKPPLSKVARQQEIAAAVAAKETLMSLVGDGIVKLKCDGWDKYGRLLGTIYDKDGRNINNIMVENGWGVPYNGKTKQEFNADNWNPKPVK
jgi:endonuclease YncB( thermonuclease family)